MKIFKGHSFHIPVLGVGYSIDTPLKVAKYGVSSVVSLVDDVLLEQLREKYSAEFNEEFTPIPSSLYDSRAKRITAYLNLLNRQVKKQFEELKKSSFEASDGIKKYIEMLPEYSTLKQKYIRWKETNLPVEKAELETWIRENIFPGSIDVNIMTKVDKENRDNSGVLLPVEFNDAHAALRGFANSELESSIVFSAGLNPRLYSYAESFKDFFPDRLGNIKKKIIIKVSDFRSALVQGKFFAKKGLWVSEFRVESGLNCGGHAFATDGYLLGPIMEEFKIKKDELIATLKDMVLPALKKKEIDADPEKLNLKITVQGGVGTASEHQFLLNHYNVDSVGWGSPFLLVPEVMNVDEYTLKRITEAEEGDFYLSNTSPLGVPFNSLKGNSKDIEKERRIEEGKPGSPCTKKYLLFKREISDKPMCPASIAYFKEINRLKKQTADTCGLQKEYEKSLEKSCLCEGLSASALITNGIGKIKQSLGVSICPGPNMAYFNRVASFKEMVDHIYGRINLIADSNRPNLFLKELDLYINYLEKRLKDKLDGATKQTEEYITAFRNNLASEMQYYKNLVPQLVNESEKMREKFKKDLEELEQKFYLLFQTDCLNGTT